MSDPPRPAPSGAGARPRRAAHQLTSWLADTLSPAFADGTVERIGVGHSRAMFTVTATDGSRVVVRVEQGGVFGTDGSEESAIMRGLHGLGFPVAPIVAAEPTGDVLGEPFFVMSYLEGDSPADERALDVETATAFVDVLHALHRLDGAGLDVADRPPEPSDATPAQVDRWHAVYRSAVDRPIPLLEEAAAWLRLHAPPLECLSVVHGDAGPGNFVHRDGRVVAITDWEFAHLGDPAEDWAFCLTMRGARTLSRVQWIELFRDRAGFELDDDGWRYWEAFNLFKGACANRTCLAVFESGRNRAPNMAIIGTALHQMFLRRLVDIVHRDEPTRE